MQFAATEWWNRAKNAIVDGRKIARKSAVSPCAVSSSPERGLVLWGLRPLAHLLRYLHLYFMKKLKNQQICVVQGPCCTESCQLRYGVKCRDDNGCRDAAFCDGTGPRCPPSNNKANKTVCNEEFVCFMGVSFFFILLTTFRDFISWQQQQQECTGSICIAYGLQSCQCLQGPNDPPTKACELCCKLPGDDQPCL